MMRYLLLLALVLLAACQPASAQELPNSERQRQPIIMLDSYGWVYQRGHVVQQKPGNVYLSLPSLKHGKQLLSVTATWRGGAGHSGLSDISQPVLWVYQQDENGGEQHLGLKPDGAVSVLDYEAPHRITAHIGGAYYIDLASCHYYVRLTSEQGPGFMPGSRVTALLVETSP